MVSKNTGLVHTIGIVVEFMALVILLLGGTAGAAPPTIINLQPVSPLDILSDFTQNFTIMIGDQNGVLRWIENDKTLLAEQLVNSGQVVTYTYNAASAGTYKITANISNNNGSNIQEWILKVRPGTYFKGSRIWDGSKPDNFSLTYSWDPMSFSGFYYSAKDDVGTENLKIYMDSYSSRTIKKRNIVYTTSPQEVNFAFPNFGKYQIIGFIGEKYFVGYTINTGKSSSGNTLVTRPTTDFEGKSALSQGDLHKVLIDDDINRTISVGGTIALQDGYVLKATDIDFNARTMLISLLKDGNEVDISPLSADETYVYYKDVGGVESLPLIMIRLDKVFSEQELQVALIKGLFQISESAITVKSGNKYGSMEVAAVSQNGIQMNNDANVSLNKSSAVNIMRNFNIKVANNDSVRFTPSVEETAYQEIRSAIYRSTDPIPITQWTPYNFGMNTWLTNTGFYYDIDEDVGSERLTLKIPIYSRAIPDKMLQYSTSVQEVNFKYPKFGKYNVMGFMADKYFTGYTANTGRSSSGAILITRPTTDFERINTFSNGTIHKVLMDDDIKRTISVGSTIALKEGYALKVIDIDLNARTMLLSLLRDGIEVDISPISRDETYVYSKTVGNESLPLIMARFDNIFSGQELQLGFLRGMFQISEIPTAVNIGDHFNMMEVTEVNNNTIVMNNNGSIGLDKDKDDALLGKIRLKVADSDDLRFYFAVDPVIDNIFPVISSVKLDNRFPIEGESILVSVNATDNVGVTGVRANEAVLSVRGGKTVTWSGSITALEGTHSVNVSARDEAGHIAWNNSTVYEAAERDEMPDSDDALPDIRNATIFRGKVTIDGNAVPDGTKVEAKAGTVLRGMDSEGTSSGNYDLAVFAKKEILTFYVNNRSSQTYDLSRKDKGRIIILNLSITTGGSISGMKFNDSDGDGIKDQGESGLANWTIVLKNSSGSLNDTTITKNNGSYTFSGLAAGNYAVEEVLRTGWTQTFPQAPGVYNVTVSDGEIKGIDFGNNLKQPLSTGVNASRHIENDSLGPGGSTNIIVQVNSDITQALALQEFIPAKWKVTTISDGAVDLKNTANVWAWSNVTPGITKTVIYKITAPKSAAAGTYHINGTITNSSGIIAAVGGDNIITVDIAGYYRRLGGDPDKVETGEMLKAMDDWKNRKAPSGFDRPLTNQELSEIINEWLRI